MAEHDRQHFVPQFYLRHFATDVQRKRIATFRIEEKHFIATTSIRNQAQRHRLYGGDAIESMFTTMEAESSKVIRSVIQNLKIPKRASPEYVSLAIFVLFQSARTPVAGQEIEDMVNNVFQHLVSKDPRMVGYAGKFRMVHKRPALVSLHHAIHGRFLLMDLAPKLLISEETPLITSDHPVVFYNQFMENRRTFGGSTGLACKGLQVFLPLSPRVCLILYDYDTYRVGGRSLTSVCQRIGADDAFELNKLQCIHAGDQIFFNGAVSEAYVTKLIAASHKHRMTSRAGFQAFPETQRADGKTSQIIMTHRNDIHCKLKISAITETEKAKNYVVGDKAFHGRNSPIIRIYEEFEKGVDEGRWSSDFFDEYISQRLKH